MFSGIVEETGRLAAVEPRDGGARFRIGAAVVLEGTRPGDSIAVNGCCLTAVGIGAGWFDVDAVPETLRRTTLGDLRPGDAVNLERAVRLDQRLGGHLVQGHIDGVGEVRWIRPEGEGRRAAFAVPASLARFVAEKGSIAIDGVSLTVAACAGDECEVALIPHTLAVTVAGGYRTGVRVNLEVDLLARYVARLFEAEREGSTDER
jgi:riboflavin synthase